MIPADPMPTQVARRPGRQRALLIGVALGLLVSVAIGLIPRRLQLAEAQMIGDRVMASWQRRAGVPPWHLGPRETLTWADGWEMRWRYRPCAAMASLRIVISRDGRSVRVTEYPDCAPARGAGQLPLTV